MGEISKELKNCLVCESENLKDYLDLAMQPLANNYTDIVGKSFFTFPLKLNYCRNCSHSQLSLAIDPKLMFTDYAYVSGTTERLRWHFRDLAVKLLNERGFFTRSDFLTILDIGANDGSLLQAFREVAGGCQSLYTYGVDPAKNLQIETFKKGIPVLVDYWTEELGKKLNNKFEIITALNCLAHNSNPRDFLMGVFHALKKDGLAVVEVPSHHKTLENLDAGQVYFEHYSYFSKSSLRDLAQSCGFQVTIEEVDIHNGSLRAYLTKGYKFLSWGGEEFIREEEVDIFFGNVFGLIQELLIIITGYKSQGFNIVAYGASAKSVTLWNFAMRTFPEAYDRAKPLFVYDDNERKQGKFIPNTDLYIRGAHEYPLSGGKDLYICTSHNFREEIKERLRNKGLGGIGHKILTYSSKIEVEDL